MSIKGRPQFIKSSSSSSQDGKRSQRHGDGTVMELIRPGYQANEKDDEARFLRSCTSDF